MLLMMPFCHVVEIAACGMSLDISVIELCVESMWNILQTNQCRLVKRSAERSKQNGILQFK